MGENEIRLLLAARLKEYREIAGLTIRDVGDAIGKSEKTVSAWEHGRGQPDADMLFKLCDLYGISDIGIFYGRTSKPNITDICSVSRSDLSASESELLTLYRSVSEVGQEHILSTARLVAGNPGMKKDALPHAR